MKTITKEFTRENIYPVECITKGYTPVLFDIETTGLKAETSYLYLIGVLEIKRDRLNFIQWFAEKPSEELQVLENFLSWLPDRACLIHFNGRGFDVPYLEKKCKQYGIPSRLSQMPNVDIYRSLAPLKDYFNMQSRRLVAYERLIGLDREDCFNGGELIDVYKEYVGKSKFNKEDAEKLERLLLLHNEEDIRDMVPVLSLFTFMDLFAGNFECFNVMMDCAEPPKALNICLDFAHSFPLNYEKSIATDAGLDNIKVITEGKTAIISIPILTDRLKHFYPDYKNYYYLPAENSAIHKSVASCVDPDHREVATKSTAYTWAEGSFIPQRGTLLTPNFKKELTDSISYIPVNSLKDNESVKAYVRALF